MSERAKALAARIEEGARILARFAESLSDAQWCAPVPPDGRTAGVMIHHVASVYPVEVELARRIASGQAVSGVTWDVVADMNARHAREHGQVGRRPTIDLLLANSREAAEAVRQLSDAELDRAAPFSLNADAPLTAQFVIEDHALRHSWHHLGKLRAALGGA